MPRIDILYFNAGGGHRSAAMALQAVIAQQQRPWDLRLVNLNEILLKTDIFKKLTGLGLEDLYNLILKKGWTLGSTQLLPVMHAFIRHYHSTQVELITEFWRQDPPDMVISVIPNFNRAIYQALRKVSAKAPFTTIITDLADYPPHMWIEKQEGAIICGTPKAFQQARDLGHTEDEVFQTSGMILRPTFYDVKPIDRIAERIRLGLNPDLPTGIVLFGGQGAPVMRQISERMDRAANPSQLILMCGHNEKLAAKLKTMKLKMPFHVQGFTQEVPYFMQLADFLIGKPGPGSVSEALAMGLPVIVERNAWTMPQERYNAEWIMENNFGIALGNFRQITQAVDKMLEPKALASYKASAAAYKNRAVFEIPDMLEKILERRRPRV
jgi:1,2-diacylglycerol 3-beta-galactosyltransferase